MPQKVYHTVEADATHLGMRLDRFLASKLTDLSRSRIKALILDDQITDGKSHIVNNPSQIVRVEQTYTLAIPPVKSAVPTAQNIPLDVYYEDDDLIVVNKPAGMVVHPAHGHESGTLVNALLHHCGESLSGIGGVARPGIVHRLDKDTSGLLVVAKNDKAHQKLSAQFADHGRTGPLVRSYEAIVWGTPHPIRGTIDAPLGRAPHSPLKQAVVKPERGKFAITYYQLISHLYVGGADVPMASHMICQLETGRTHQIRVHMTHKGNPLIGDNLYGQGFKTKLNRLPEPIKLAIEQLNRQALHAKELGFAHPSTGETLHFTAPLPDELAALLTLFNVKS